jgi:hypothetical protein
VNDKAAGFATAATRIGEPAAAAPVRHPGETGFPIAGKGQWKRDTAPETLEGDVVVHDHFNGRSPRSPVTSDVLSLSISGLAAIWRFGV